MIPVRSFAALALLLFAFVTDISHASAAEAPITHSATVLDLSDEVEICESDVGQDITEIAAGSCRFAAATPATLQPGFSVKAHWLRVDLINPTTQPVERWLRIGHPRLGHVTFFEDEGNGEWKRSDSGLAVSMAERPVFSIDSVLRLSLAPSERRAIFVRVVSNSSINLTPTLWQDKDYAASVSKRSNACSFIVGSQIITCILTLIIFLKWNEISYLYFSVCEVTLAVFTACFGGLIPTYLWPNTDPFDIRIQFVALGISLVSFILFSCRFIGLHHHYKINENILLVLGAIVTAATVWTVFIDFQHGVSVILAGALAIKLTCVLLFWRARRDGFHPAGFLLASNLIVLCGAAQMIFKTFGGIPTNDFDAVVLMSEFLLSAPIGVFGIALHRQQLESRLREVEKESRSRVEFLARMSHELRTPLDTILGTAQLLSCSSGRLRLAEGLTDIRDSGRHLLKMIDEILDHARGLAGRLSLAPEPMDWKKFLRGVESNARMFAIRNGNEFFLQAEDAPGRDLILDERRLRQVLDNLLVNATRHTRHGWIRLECAFGSLLADGSLMVNFAVTDSGEGIPLADQERIFLPFERGRGVTSCGDGKGAGMGLAISRQLVDMMGGVLTVDSRPGRGACFHFQVVAQTREARHSASKPISYPVVSDKGTQRTILVVEDENKNRSILATFLRESGLHVLEAGSGREAISQCRCSVPVDLVLTDQFMSNGDGWAVLRRIRELFPDVPVVLISAAPSERPADFPQGVGFSAHLLKPLDHDEVLRCIADLLGLDLEREDVSSHPTETSAPSSLMRPDDAALAQLRIMIENGQVSEILNWAERLTACTPAYRPFTDQITAAALTLDFPALHNLVNT